MIQEKDFLYRVPVKTAPITTPRGQIRNPEILVDLEGGEFMHGNILDANSTNKLINQSVKDAIDNSIIEGNYATKDLLENEMSARSSKDTELENSIAEEKTRAQNKENEISDKLAIVDGDSNTEGSFRKAIADVIAAAPEDLDTLKEIADKLAGNDDLHTALNQAITEKADASALANEVSRATGAESGLQDAIATKADATALSNYVLTTALNQQVDTLNTAISAKQDAGNYLPYKTVDKNNNYSVLDSATFNFGNLKYFEKYETSINGLGVSVSDTERQMGMFIRSNSISISDDSGTKVGISDKEGGQITIDSKYNGTSLTLSKVGATILDEKRQAGTFIRSNNISIFDASDNVLTISKDGIALSNGDNNHVLTSNASTIDITQYAKKNELPTVPTKTSQLTNDSNFIAAANVGDNNYTLQKSLWFGAGNTYLTIGTNGVSLNDQGRGVSLSNTGFQAANPGGNCIFGANSIEMRSPSGCIRINPISITSSDVNEINSFGISPTSITLGDSSDSNVKISSEGIKFAGKTNKDIPTANGGFIDIDNYVRFSVYDEKIAALEARIAALEAKHPEAAA